MNNARKERFDVVVVWRFDRFAQLTKLLTIDKGKLTKKLGYLSEERMAEVDEAIRISLGIAE